MATLPLSKLVLNDRFPGPVNPNMSIPSDGWDGTDHSCVTSPAYPRGTKIMAYTDNSHCPGWYTMYYYTLAEGSDTNHCVSADISDGKGWLAHTCLTQDVSDVAGADPTYKCADWDGSSQPPHVLSTCISATLNTKDVSGCGPIGLPCCSLSGYQYGWAWVGGVCPCKDVTFLDDVNAAGSGAELTTDGAVVEGACWLCITGGTALLSAADWSSLIDDTVPHAPQGPPTGYSTEAD